MLEVQLRPAAELGGTGTVKGVKVKHVRPGGFVSVSVIVPMNPLTALTVIVEVALIPARTPGGDVAVIVKSVTWKAAVVECDNVPLVPVSVTV